MAAIRLIVTAVHVAGHQVPAELRESPEQLLAKTWGIVDLKSPIVVLEYAMGRGSALHILDQQAVGGQLQDVGRVGLLGCGTRLDLNRNETPPPFD
jgi:hypothetical protein